MKFHCPRREFYDVASQAAQALGTRSPMQVLQNLLLDAQDGTLRIVGSDGELWIERSTEAVVTSPGQALVPGRLLTDLLGKLPDGDVMVEWSGTQIQVTDGGSTYQLVAANAQDFPSPPEISPDRRLELPIGLFRDAVDSVAFAVAPTAMDRPAISGILFLLEEDQLTLVATDTHRLAVRRAKGVSGEGTIQVVIPEKAVRAVKALNAEDSTPITLHIDENLLSVSSGPATITSMLINGPFPNWQRVVPQEHTRSWSIETDKLREVVGRALLVARESANRVKFHGNGQVITLLARGEQGEANEVVEAVTSNGDVDIAFNGKYVQDALTPIKGPGVRVEITESSRPAIFRSADDDEGYLCVIMPMALA
ncbi:MAG: DNA polymerase III subunit beta [Fimbriimonadaceae bacterium]